MTYCDWATRVSQVFNKGVRPTVNKPSSVSIEMSLVRRFATSAVALVASSPRARTMYLASFLRFWTDCCFWGRVCPYSSSNIAVRTSSWYHGQLLFSRTRCLRVGSCSSMAMNLCWPSDLLLIHCCRAFQDGSPFTSLRSNSFLQFLKSSVGGLVDGLGVDRAVLALFRDPFITVPVYPPAEKRLRKKVASAFHRWIPQPLTDSVP